MDGRELNSIKGMSREKLFLQMLEYMVAMGKPQSK
jgi:hypothetical protein